MNGRARILAVEAVVIVGWLAYHWFLCPVCRPVREPAWPYPPEGDDVDAMVDDIVRRYSDALDGLA